MATASAPTDVSKIQLGISLDVMESLKAYGKKYGITTEEAANFIIQSFLTEDGFMDIEPGPMVVLDDDVYNYIKAEFQAGLDSVKSESDWISKEEMREFVNKLRTS